MIHVHLPSPGLPALGGIPRVAAQGASLTVAVSGRDVEEAGTVFRMDEDTLALRLAGAAALVMPSNCQG